MTASITVRSATPDDLAQLVAPVGRYWAFEHVEGFAAERVHGILARLISDARLGGVWVAAAGGRPVGYLIAVLVFSVEYGGVMAELDEFFLLPEARAGGLGSRLLAHAEHALAGAGCAAVQLQVGVDNAAARGFYLKRGYAPRAGYALMDKPLR